MYILYYVLCVCMYIHVFACMCACMYVFMHVLCVCMYVCMHVCVFACMCVCMYVCMHVHMILCVCMYMCIHVSYMYINHTPRLYPALKVPKWRTIPLNSDARSALEKRTHYILVHILANIPTQIKSTETTPLPELPPLIDKYRKTTQR